MKLQKVYIIIINTILLTFCAACGSEQSSPYCSTNYGFRDIILESPLNIYPRTEIKEGFFVFPWNIVTNSTNQLYFIDKRYRRILHYSEEGDFLGYVGRIGRGPGESVQPLQLYSNDHALFVWDFGSQKIHEFGLEGSYKGSIKIDKILDLNCGFFVSKEKEIYGVTKEYKESSMAKLLAKFTPEGKIAKVIHIIKKWDTLSFVMGGIIHEYSPKFFLKPTGDGFYFCNNSDRKIYYYDTRKGASKIVMTLGYDKQRINHREKEYFIKAIGKKEFDNMLPYRPYYYDILVDNYSRIYLVKMPSILTPIEKKHPIVDAFNSEGEFLFRFELPSLPTCIKGKCIYFIKEDENDIVYLNKSLMKFKVKSNHD